MHRWVAAVSVGAVLCLSQGCKKDPKTPEYWAGELDDAKGKGQKVEVLEKLRASGNLNATMLPFLHKRLQDEKSADVKSAIAHDLGEVHDASSVEPLANAIDVTNPSSETNHLNKEIAQALGRIKDPRGVPPLLRLVKQENFTRIEAIQSLGSLKANDAVQPLLEIVAAEDSEPFVVKKAIQALGQIGDPRAVVPLTKMLFIERKGMSFYPESSFALFLIGKPAASAMVGVLKGEDSTLKTWAKDHKIIEPALLSKAAQVLGDLDDPRAEAPLVSRLGYAWADPAEKMYVRMMSANALGRMRSKAAIKPLEGMVEEPEPLVRAEYVRALTQIGDKDAIGALLKSAEKGPWEAREMSVAGVTLLGTSEDAAAIAKLEKDEAATTAASCKAGNEDGCDHADKLVTDHVKALAGYRTALKATDECKKDAGCWAKKLDDADMNVRRRAALELGRSGSSEYVKNLTAHLGEKDSSTRLYIIQAVSWLLEKNPAAGKDAQDSLPAIHKQLEDERGKQDYVQVDEDLRRLAARLERA